MQTPPARSPARVCTILAATVLALAVAATAAPAKPKSVGWLPPFDISCLLANPGFPVVASNDRGDVVVAWQDEPASGNGRIQATVRPKGGSFGPIETVSAPSSNASGALAGIDNAGNVVVAWAGTQGALGQIQAALRPAGGSFGPQLAVPPSGVDAADPALAVNGRGHAVVAWLGPGPANSIAVRAAFGSSTRVLGRPLRTRDRPRRPTSRGRSRWPSALGAARPSRGPARGRTSAWSPLTAPPPPASCRPRHSALSA